MAINPELLIAAPMLQDYLVDNANGNAMANGTIYMYHDNARTTFKNWYYQSGAPGAYTYVVLANPLTLSAVGTITDPDGNDTIPFYYPYSEIDNQSPDPYYVKVFDSNGQQQFTRQNFPFLGTNTSPIGNTVPTLRNYIVNNVFWRNIGTKDVSALTDVVIAPSQHEGYTNPDIRFIKNTTDATDTISFLPFGAGNDPLRGDITPEYYVNLACTSAGTETLKCIQIPLALHIKTLENIQATITIQAQNVGGSPNNTLQMNLLQYLGTGGATSPVITLQTLTLTDNWTKYVISFVFPSSAGLVLGAGGDDAFFLQVSYPVGLTCDINFIKQSLYLSNQIPTNDFDTYDDIETIINSPRTGDVKHTNNTYQPGWVGLNDSTIGSAASNATTRANQDTWPLFNQLWNNAAPYSNGSTNYLYQMYNSSAVPVAYGSSAIADFADNNQLQLSDADGKVIMSAHSPDGIQSTFSVSGSTIILAQRPGIQYFTGAPIVFTTTGSFPSPLVSNQVYYSIFLSGNNIQVASTFDNAIQGIPITLSGSGSGTMTAISWLSGTTTPLEANQHVLNVNQMPAHSHDYYFNPFVAGTALSLNSDQGANQVGVLPTSTVGGGGAHNNVPAVAFYNGFIKL